jgi:pyruvate dehydrogenase E1 component beta subunit
MKSAIRDNDPVMFMENTILYGEKWEVPDGEYLVPLGKADILRAGTDLSIIGHGRASSRWPSRPPTSSRSEHNINAEVVDLRSIRPLDEDTILNSVKKTNRALYVEESKPFCSVGAMVAAIISRQGLRLPRRPGQAPDLDRRPRHLFHAPRKTPAPQRRARIYQAALETLK